MTIARERHAPVGENDPAGGHFEARGVLLDQQDGGALLAVDARDDAEDFLRQQRRQAEAGLVHQHQRRARQHVVDQITNWRSQVFRDRILMKPTTSPADPTDLNDLQREVLATKSELRARGLPEGQP